MNKKWLKLAGELLMEASDEYSNHGCNDWEFPAYFSKAEKKELIEEMIEYTGNKDLDVDFVPDWLIMSFLGEKLSGG